jgi:hypothetical protein
MNKSFLLQELLWNVEEVHEEFAPKIDSISDKLFKLQSRRSDAITTLPWSLQAPSDSRVAVEALRKHFGDRVTLVSFVLSQIFPREFLFFRTGDLENAIFDGFAFFSDSSSLGIPINRLQAGLYPVAGRNVMVNQSQLDNQQSNIKELVGAIE